MGQGRLKFVSCLYEIVKGMRWFISGQMMMAAPLDFQCQEAVRMFVESLAQGHLLLKVDIRFGFSTSRQLLLTQSPLISINISTARLTMFWCLAPRSYQPAAEKNTVSGDLQVKLAKVDLYRSAWRRKVEQISGKSDLLNRAPFTASCQWICDRRRLCRWFALYVGLVGVYASFEFNFGP